MNEENLVQKIQRRLAPHERLRKMRLGSGWVEYGPYYIEDCYSSTMVAWGIDDLNWLLQQLSAE